MRVRSVVQDLFEFLRGDAGEEVFADGGPAFGSACGKIQRLSNVL